MLEGMGGLRLLVIEEVGVDEVALLLRCIVHRQSVVDAEAAAPVPQADDQLPRAVFNVPGKFRRGKHPGNPRLQQLGPADLPETKGGPANDVTVAQTDSGEEGRGIQVVQRIQRLAQMLLELLPALVTAASKREELPGEGQGPSFVPGTKFMCRLPRTQRQVPGEQCGQLSRQACLPRVYFCRADAAT